MLLMNETDKWADRQTDGWTPDRYMDPLPHTVRAWITSIRVYLYRVTLC